VIFFIALPGHIYRAPDVEWQNKKLQPWLGGLTSVQSRLQLDYSSIYSDVYSFYEQWGM